MFFFENCLFRENVRETQILRRADVECQTRTRLTRLARRAQLQPRVAFNFSRQQATKGLLYDKHQSSIETQPNTTITQTFSHSIYHQIETIEITVRYVVKFSR